MSDNKTVTVTVGRTGRVTIDADGFEGCGCAEATEAVELILGGAQKKDEKPEMFAGAQQVAEGIQQQF